MSRVGSRRQGTSLEACPWGGVSLGACPWGACPWGRVPGGVSPPALTLLPRGEGTSCLDALG